MTIHLIKNPVSRLALETISYQAKTQTPPPVVVLLSPTDETPTLPGVQLYRLTDLPLENANPPGDSIDYTRLIDLIFSAQKVVAW